MQGQFHTSDGLRIAYEVDDFTDPWKPPATLLMLHAAMGSSRRFYAMVPHLARHFRVVRMDLRGHGNSQVPVAVEPLTMQRLMADALELMDDLGCPTVHLAGASAGGYVAQHLAMDVPARVDSLALFASTPGLKHTQVTSWLPRIAKDGLRAFLEQTIWERFPRETTDPGLVRWFIDETAKNDPAYIARFVGLMSTLDWSDQLHRISCPTLMVIPGAETVGDISVYDTMRQRIPDVRVLVYEGQPHNLSDAAPDRCAEDLLGFLRERFCTG